MSSTTGDHSYATVLEDAGRVARDEDARRLAELGYEPPFQPRDGRRGHLRPRLADRRDDHAGADRARFADLRGALTKIISFAARPYRHGTAAHGDAVRMR